MTYLIKITIYFIMLAITPLSVYANSSSNWQDIDIYPSKDNDDVEVGRVISKSYTDEKRTSSGCNYKSCISFMVSFKMTKITI